jgi:fructosamine-3-kinase
MVIGLQLNNATRSWCMTSANEVTAVVSNMVTMDAEQDDAVYEIVAALAFRSISTSSAYRLGQSVAVVVSGPIPGAALAATTTNPAPEAY